MQSSQPIVARRRRRAPPGRALLVLAAVALSWLLAAPAAAAAQQCLEQTASRAAERPAQAAPADDWEAWMCASDRAAREWPASAVPMCLSEGASAVAPRPIHPVDGARAEAVHRCPDRDGAEQWRAGSPDKPSKPPPPAPHDGTLATPPASTPPSSRPVTIEHPLPGPGPAGVKPSVYRPPRP